MISVNCQKFNGIYFDVVLDNIAYKKTLYKY